MRKVTVHKLALRVIEGRLHAVEVDDGVATFHRFGSGHGELESGPGNYATAIIERPGGAVESIPVVRIKFVEPTPVE